MPAPRLLTVPLAGLFLGLRSAYYFTARTFFCEPFFKAHCTRYGKHLHTGVFFHWIQGRGRLIVGDNVEVDGACSFIFAARYSAHPTLTIGSNSGIGHHSSFTVGREITIGCHCRIAPGVTIFDAPGHPLDPVQRQAGAAASAEDVKPVVIEDNVWIGQGAIIVPGVTIGRDSVVAAGSVVMKSVPPRSLVAGNPARLVMALAGGAPQPSQT